MLVKIVILAMFAAILISLGYSLVALTSRRKDASDRLLKGLTVRISLSVALFVLLMLAYALGLITPHDVEPPSATPPAATQ
ncbi:MAG: DUF2909 domain-containing protein [Gammaproteobacteria bacterium]|nr:DUF2909 domain-containing protein [Gammaproteobacteria bacterium]